MTLTSFVGGFSVLATLALYSAGISICKQIKKQNSSEGISPNSFIIGLLCASINFEYGLLRNDISITVTNLFGIICQSAFIIYYSIYSIQKKQLLKTIMVTIMAILILTLTIVNIRKNNPELAVNYLGIASCSLALMFFASPLLTLTKVIKERNIQSMSFPFSLIAFIVTLSWTFYGILINDPYVQIPNVLGCLISVFQLYLFYHYRTHIYKEVSSQSNI